MIFLKSDESSDPSYRTAYRSWGSGHNSQPMWLDESRPHTVPLLGPSWAHWSLMVASSPMLTQSSEMVLPEVMRSHGPGWLVHKILVSV